MSKPCLLFQRALSTTSTDFTVGDLVLEGPTRGMIIITQLFITPRVVTTAGSTIRVHHTTRNSEPSTSNVILLFNVSAYDDYRGRQKGAPIDTKIVVSPGDRIYAHLHSEGVGTITAYGLKPNYE
tara:strand:+ start:6631 stop:7005 length:375 start_codon:yes stop_codon:yes gene_type:complete